ncbi:DUF4148 domain-containing protein [Paraburkholderia sp. ZP32-5]|uniref:DUF4148 domain-containing protein n=1 Tax=Paraburkholderia sp. ZP32-5 TaxID=2883245 RepID=UPI001F45AE92|nr:DUF4148 domain-containing protein [Paraburkholderia sp. ZP32-5]
MKLLINAVCAAVILVPMLSNAAEPVTRAQVIAELEQLEAAGYNPGVADDSYPENLEQAQAVLQQRKNVATSYGSDARGTTQSGH